MRAGGDVIRRPRSVSAIRRDATLADDLEAAEVRVVEPAKEGIGVPG